MFHRPMRRTWNVALHCSVVENKNRFRCRIFSLQILANPSYQFNTSSIYKNVTLVAWDPAPYSVNLHKVTTLSWPHLSGLIDVTAVALMHLKNTRTIWRAYRKDSEHTCSCSFSCCHRNRSGHFKHDIRVDYSHSPLSFIYVAFSHLPSKWQAVTYFPLVLLLLSVLFVLLFFVMRSLIMFAGNAGLSASSQILDFCFYICTWTWLMIFALFECAFWMVEIVWMFFFVTEYEKKYAQGLLIFFSSFVLIGVIQQ